MQPARIIFPGFWFGRSDIAQAEAWARRGVGGFCVYGGSAKQTLDFTRRMNEASPYGQLLFCADIKEQLSEVVLDAPTLMNNRDLAATNDPDAAYRKGNLLGRMARAVGINWVLGPIVDLGYKSPCLSDEPDVVTQLAVDSIAGISNVGVLSCIKHFPGVSGVLKTLNQLEEAEIIPYQHLFRRADAIMPSDMIFPNLDEDAQAMMSPKIITQLLRKRLNYKGCVVGFPMASARLRNTAAGAAGMLRAGVEILLAPKEPQEALEAVTREAQTAAGFELMTHSISNQEMFLSKVAAGPEPEDIKTVFEIARKA